jgi:hypothetical protein
MGDVISLGTYRRRRAKAKAGMIGRDVPRVLGKVAIFLPGILVTLAFLGLRLAGVVDWHAAWIALPLLIDVGLWYANARALFVIYKALERWPFRPLQGSPA